ncbi:MAG: DAK2 domain-containing protein [Actinobacteria bacterium]|nr:DAK2 domain-containing protein [Actinomycetota bacterium]
MIFAKLNGREVQNILDIIITNFKENEEKINNLNVFPVPDGDTGTNMLLTLKAIKQEVINIKSYTLKNIVEKISFGALMGARGNSGVILSQIIKGFLDKLLSKKNMDLYAIRDALDSSKKLAYSSVQNPTEGTMLTTIKDIHQSVDNLNNNTTGSISYIEILDNIIEEAEKSVIRSTYILPVLKKADVVDAGAQGILDIIIGFKKALIELKKSDCKLENTKKSKNKKESAKLNNKGILSESSINDSGNINSNNKMDVKKDFKSLKDINVSTDIKYVYCTELVVLGDNINIDRLKQDIERFGDSALVVGNEKLVKVHVHTNYPQKVLKRTIREGTLHEIQINNMIDQSKQARGIEEAEEKKEKIGLLVVANGDGIEEVFKSIGVDVIIKGGQSMNPSTYDIVKAINKLEADKIVIFPNNKNIILTANQAKRIVKKDIIVVPTKSIPQGITAILNYNPDLEVEENIFNMKEAVNKIKSGEVTTAVRKANLLVGEIKKGDYIGLEDGKVRVISDNLVGVVIDLIKDMSTGNEEIVTFYTGKDAKKEDSKSIEGRLKECLPKLEVEFHDGGQPLYPYIFSIE